MDQNFVKFFAYCIGNTLDKNIMVLDIHQSFPQQSFYYSVIEAFTRDINLATLIKV